MSIFFPLDSTNSSENIYTMMNPIGPGGNRPNVSLAHDSALWRSKKKVPSCYLSV